ncbi:hypothetical protein [Pseudomonas mosselii]|uniref:hypothetical protein n=1 Tax=Pseudomonas TaxID=286 RepID=UPI0018D6EB55|nr:hypothetical protein [Pseudomonas mosselii]MBH3307941.1 hypothetical protein [Pseudomonas mosselii]MBH3326569.1 hypothetical protein [Pseudomonas mosselii]
MTATPAPALQAAFRDASWFRRPDVRSVKMAHVLRADGTPACGLVAMMCDPEPAAGVHVALRCRRPGCAGRWPDNDPTDEHAFGRN